MSDSNITKKAFAGALKELLKEMPLEKVNVAQITEKCDMNRKSFYYHFRDKYDLVNWVFDTEIYPRLCRETMNRWEFLEIVCDYFYENRSYYRKVLRYRGQNSFSEHFREILTPLLHARLQLIIGREDVPAIWLNIIGDGISSAVERWLMSDPLLPPEEFIQSVKELVETLAGEYKE